MNFSGNIVYLRPCSVICCPSAARDANDTTRAQINNILEKSHFIIIVINIQGQIISRYLIRFMYFFLIQVDRNTLNLRYITEQV